MERIYHSEGEEMAIPCESKGNDIEEKFISSLVDLICDILQIGWNDRRIVRALLINGLGEKLNNRYKDQGLLQQYMASQLDTAIKRFYSELDVPKSIKVNHDYAPHAKFANLVDWIKINYKGEKPELCSGSKTEPKTEPKNPEEPTEKLN